MRVERDRVLAPAGLAALPRLLEEAVALEAVRASISGVSSSSRPAGANEGRRVACTTATSGGEPPTAASASFV